MNTQDPNEKVAKIAAPHHDDEPTPNVVVPDAVDISAPAAAAHDEPPKPQNLPQYHHHRSTALW
jgi:hypothetical protein